MEKNVITWEGYQLMKKKLSELEKNSKEIANKLSYARLDGDLSENADWIVLRENLENTQDKINKIRNLLENSELIEEDFENKGKFVRLASKVLYKTIDEFDSKNEILEIEITNEIDSDPFIGKVSCNSPFGSSLIGKEVGDIVDFVGSSKSSKNYKIKIMEIK